MTQVALAQEPTNRHFWHSLETSAASGEIWDIWTDVENWNKWDTGLNDAELEMEFQLHAEGTIISLEGRRSRFKVVDFVPGVSYTFRTKLPFGGLYVKRYLSESDGRTIFTHEVWFKGLTSSLFAKSFGSKFRAMLPEVMENIKLMAEGR